MDFSKFQSHLSNLDNSSSEHPRAHLSHCCFLPKSRAHASAPANTIWPLRAFMPALIPSVFLLLGSEVRCRQSSRCSSIPVPRCYTEGHGRVDPRPGAVNLVLKSATSEGDKAKGPALPVAVFWEIPWQ